MQFFAAFLLLAVAGFAHAIAPNTGIYQEPELLSFHQDLTGNTIAATDINGNLLYTEQYRPYGERLTNNATSQATQPLGNRIWFHGKVQDEATGLQYFGARYYDPVIGRFMGVDPVAFKEDNIHSFNRYAYGNNNPYRYRDPDGRSALTFFEIGLITAGAIIVASNSLSVEQKSQLNRAITKLFRGNIAHNETANSGDSEGANGDAGAEKPSDGKTGEKVTDNNRKPAPALPGDPYNPAEVDKRRSELRDRLKAPSRDPDSPIPNQGPGKDTGGHEARGRTPHETGERNVNKNEEHSRRPKANPSGQQR